MNLENSQIKLLSKILPEKIDFPPASKEIKLSLSCTSFKVEIINDKMEELYFVNFQNMYRKLLPCVDKKIMKNEKSSEKVFMDKQIEMIAERLRTARIISEKSLEDMAEVCSVSALEYEKYENI